MFKALIGLLRPKPMSKKREWSIMDDMPVRARYAVSHGSNQIQVTPEEYAAILESVHRDYPLPAGVLTDPDIVYYAGCSLVIRQKENE